MSEYAHILDNQIKEIVDLQPSLHAQWVATNNPKAIAYRPVIRQDMPQFDTRTHTADPLATLYSTSVVFGWHVRPKTADELRRTWTAYEFLNRFTSIERKRIWSRAKSDDDAADFLMLCQAANEVISDDPQTVAGLNYLVSINILTASRKDEILNG